MRIDTNIVRLWMLLGALFLQGCATTPPLTTTARSEWEQAHWQPGDLILTASTSWRSWLVRHFDQEHGAYSHAGLILIDHGRPLLLHATPDDGAMLQTVPLEKFLALPMLSTVAVYRAVDPQVARRAAAAAQHYLEQRVPFDDDFNVLDDSKLYCTELIWRSYLQAGVDLLDMAHHPLHEAPFYGPMIWPSDLIRSPALRRVDIRTADAE